MIWPCFTYGAFVLDRSNTLPGGLEPPTYRLTADRANQLRHGSTKTLPGHYSEPFCNKAVFQINLQYQPSLLLQGHVIAFLEVKKSYMLLKINGATTCTIIIWLVVHLFTIRSCCATKALWCTLSGILVRSDLTLFHVWGFCFRQEQYAPGWAWTTNLSVNSRTR